MVTNNARIPKCQVCDNRTSFEVTLGPDGKAQSVICKQCNFERVLNRTPAIAENPLPSGQIILEDG